MNLLLQKKNNEFKAAAENNKPLEPFYYQLLNHVYGAPLSGMAYKLILDKGSEEIINSMNK